MSLDTLIFDPSPCGFPRPRVPLLSTGLDGIAFASLPTWAPAAHFRHFSRGRYALREAYRLADIGPGRTLLAPAYHCRTMLDPALALGGNILLYPLRPDLSPDLAAFDDFIDGESKPIKALLATHFFGIPQDFRALADWCARRGIVLIEDCSHAFFCEYHRPTGIGHFGAFVVSSPYKFLPSPDGGLLYARVAEQVGGLHPSPPTWLAELRGAIHAREKAAIHRRNRSACDIGRVDAELAATVARPVPPPRELRVTAGCSSDYCAEEEGRASLRISRLLYRHPDIEAVARSRRDNYRRWTAATIDLPYYRPLYPDPPADSIPYMFPLHIEQPELHFHRLKQLGVPIYRWDSLAISNCPIANHYRLHLLHLPCHQSLTDQEMDWMIAVVRKLGAGDTAPHTP